MLIFCCFDEILEVLGIFMLMNIRKYRQVLPNGNSRMTKIHHELLDINSPVNPVNWFALSEKVTAVLLKVKIYHSSHHNWWALGILHWFTPSKWQKWYILNKHTLGEKSAKWNYILNKTYTGWKISQMKLHTNDLLHSLFKSLFTIALAESALFCFAAADCYLPPDPGPCLAYFPRYYYNIHKGTCEEFIYGGCAGNSNNFHYQGECLHVCQSHFFNV